MRKASRRFTVLLMFAVSTPAAEEPRLLSAFPYGAQPGGETVVTVRGTALKDAHAVWVAGAFAEARVLGTEEDSAAPPEGKPAAHLARIEFKVASGTAPGSYAFRMVTPRGVTNPLAFRVVNEPTLVEPARLDRFPVAVFGRIRSKGDINEYSFDVAAGEELRFDVSAGNSAFDPAVTIFEPAGSWFDASRLKRIAYQDEPLSFPGLSKDTHLTHKFAKGGRHVLRVEAFQGTGGPDFVYCLRVGKPGGAGQGPEPDIDWAERTFTRSIPSNWISRLNARAGEEKASPVLETYRAVEDGSSSIPEMKLPGVVEGVIGRAGLIQKIRFRAEAAQEVAIEVETPRDTMPVFNPVVRVLDAQGKETVTNIYTKRNNNGLYMMKMIEPKTTVGLPAAGEYTVEIRNLTPDHGAESFAYRVCLRPRVPHLGQAKIADTAVNLAPGESKPVAITIDREEGYPGLVTIEAEGLPAGVRAVVGSAFDPPKPPLPNGGNLERYDPETQRSTLVFSASADAAPTPMPVFARVVVRPVHQGKIGPVAAERVIPIMVVANIGDIARKETPPATR